MMPTCSNKLIFQDYVVCRILKYITFLFCFLMLFAIFSCFDFLLNIWMACMVVLICARNIIILLGVLEIMRSLGILLTAVIISIDR